MSISTLAWFHGYFLVLGEDRVLPIGLDVILKVLVVFTNPLLQTSKCLQIYNMKYSEKESWIASKTEKLKNIVQNSLEH